MGIYNSIAHALDLGPLKAGGQKKVFLTEEVEKHLSPWVNPPHVHHSVLVSSGVEQKRDWNALGSTMFRVNESTKDKIISDMLNHDRFHLKSSETPQRKPVQIKVSNIMQSSNKSPFWQITINVHIFLFCEDNMTCTHWKQTHLSPWWVTTSWLHDLCLVNDG